MAHPRRRKIAVGCLGVLLVLAAAFVFFARGLFFPKRYDVVPIASGTHYQASADLDRARALPVAKLYARDLLFQKNGSVCGPTSLANVARSFGEASFDADRVLEGTGQCRTGICFGGLTLDELADVARQALKNRSVTVLRALSLDAFREHMARANDVSRRYVINFDRGPLFGKAGGHHSPIGGYLAADDLVFVLDVNAKYGPWLVKTTRLYEAMDTIDTSSNAKRGLLLIE